DGGAHWSVSSNVLGGAAAVSASFADMSHGWWLGLKGNPSGDATPVLLGTVDGGVSWTDLGPPVGKSTSAFGVTFTDARHGWLDTASASPLAYTSADGGSTWRRVAIPEPAGGWPYTRGWFFIAARPTPGGGVMATVVNSKYISGRSTA